MNPSFGNSADLVDVFVSSGVYIYGHGMNFRLDIQPVNRKHFVILVLQFV